MTDSPLQLTLREVRRDLTSAKGVSALIAVGALIGISGPFQTFAFMSLGPRVLYWIVVTYVTYGVGALINIYLSVRFDAALGPLALRLMVYGLATGLGVFVAVTLINTLVFGWPYETPPVALASLGLITLISTIISGLIMNFGQEAGGRPEADPQPKLPPLLDRLLLERRGALVALSVQDHYVSVVTTKGQEMLLMRLSDAIKETAPTAGLQVHRSHWVALDQIVAAKRVGDRAVLTLSTGAEIPASRTYIPALREAGVFPKASNG